MSDVTLTPGAFCWHELATSDTDGAHAFYRELMGWGVSTDDTPMGPYHKWTLGEAEFGASYKLAGPMFEGVPPHWLPYVLVESVDATVAKAKELGGCTFMDPMDVMEHGRMAMLSDPSGAAFAVWEARSHVGATTNPMMPGAPVWTELATRDTKGSIAFYTALFDWTADEKTDGPMPYTEWWQGDNCRGGMLEIDEKTMGEVPPHWLTYFSVADCDASVAKAKLLGGTICMAPMEIPDVGRMAVITDPQGATFAIIKLIPKP